MEAVDHPEAVAGLVLIDPVLPFVRGVRPDRIVVLSFLLYALPLVGERYLARRRAALSPRQIVQEVLSVACADPGRVPAELVDAQVALAEERAAARRAETARSA